MKKQMVMLTVDGKARMVQAGEKLSVYLTGEMPCGGHGSCGKCKVRAAGALSDFSDAERRLLSQEELESGVRLGCCVQVLGDCRVETFQERAAQIAEDGVMPKFPIVPTFARFGAAVDIGTTTLAARLYDKEGNLLAQKSMINPQTRWGADVVSRMEAALGGEAEALQTAICQGVDALLKGLEQEAGLAEKSIDRLVVCGNTVMLHLLTGHDTMPLSRAPFLAEHLFGEIYSAKKLGLRAVMPETQVYIPPCMGAFVGADMVCAMVAARFCDGAETKLLADIGTNGEIGLWHQERLTVCSTAAGPAFEGVGIAAGMRGEVGAIDRVWLGGGKLQMHTIGETEAVGICGSGLIDAVACLIALGLMEENGYMEKPVALSEKVTLYQEDIRNVQLAKSAICAGIQTLLEKSQASPDKVLIAGGFGRYLGKENAGKIGLLPKELSQKAQSIGNGALSGAAMMLLQEAFCREGEGIAQKGTVLNLADSTVFSQYYMRGMMF